MIRNILAYIQGNLRYWSYYSNWAKGLIRKHIREQIAFRIKMMNRECYDRGSCVECGCATTALQMADKVCDRSCYPPMMSKAQWKTFKTGCTIILNCQVWYYTLGVVNSKKVIKIYKDRNLMNKKIFKLNEEIPI